MNPYKSIWLNPKNTFEELAQLGDKQPLIIFPIIVFGISLGLDSAQDVGSTLGNDQKAIGVILSIVLSIAIGYIILGFILPGMIKLVGKLWNGAATLTQLTNVLAISLIPYTLILFHQVLMFVFGVNPNLEEIYGGLIYVIWFWFFSLSIIGVSKVQSFSYGFALLNILVSQIPIILIRLILRN